MRCSSQDGPGQLHHFHGFHQTEHRLSPRGDLRVVESFGEPQSIQRAQAFDFDQIRYHSRGDGPPFLQCIGLTQNNTKKSGRVEVGNRRSACRSSNNSATISRRSRSGGGKETPRNDGEPGKGLRTVNDCPCSSYGTIRAIGVFRSSTVTVRPARTLRRCSLSLLFKSATRTLIIDTW